MDIQRLNDYTWLVTVPGSKLKVARESLGYSIDNLAGLYLGQKDLNKIINKIESCRPVQQILS